MTSTEDRQTRLTEGADRLAEGRRRSIAAHPLFLVAVAGALMTLGVTAIVIGWVGAAHSTFVEEQVPYLISGGLLGLALAVIGALTFFTHWLTVAIREAREHEVARRRDHVELIEALRAIAPTSGRQENQNGRAGSAGTERPVRRARRGS